MRKINVLFLAVVLLAGSVVTAATVWNPAANGIFPPATGNWNVAANWTNNVPGVADGKAVFNVADAAECIVTDAQSFNQFVQGDNGPGGVIRVMDGGSLTTGSSVWSAVGYNGESAHMIVETGGSVHFGNHMWIGNQTDGVGTLDIIGGSVRVEEMSGLGFNGGTGFLNLIAGVLDLHNLNAGDLRSISETSLFDITNGVLLLDGNQAGKIEAFVNGDRMVAFNGAGTVNWDFDVRNEGKTTVTAVHPFEPFPSTEGGVVGAGALQLSWTLPDPCTPGDPVPVDVYLTDDYDALWNFNDPASMRVLDQANATSVDVTVAGQTRYYWAVDTYVGGTSAPVVLGPIFSFWVGNQPPTIEIAADPPAGWLTDGPAEVTLDATVVDDAGAAVTFAWTVISEPNEGAVTIASPTAEDTLLTLTELGQYTLRLTADDGEPEDNISTKDITIGVFDNSCEAAQSLPGRQEIPGDINEDCVVDFLDFTAFAEGWMECSALDCGQ